MSHRIQVLFVSVFILFFLVTASFIVAKTLGYDVNLRTGELQNISTVRVDTNPSGAAITLNQTLLSLRTPTELTIAQDAVASITVSKDGFLSQTWDLNSLPNQNSYTRLENVFLLPINTRIVHTFNNNETQQLILNENTILYAKNNVWYTSLFSPGAVSTNAIPIINSAALSPAVSPTIVSLDETHHWFPQQNLILIRTQNIWTFYPIVLSEPIIQVISLGDTQVMLLTASKNMWIKDLKIDAPARLWETNISSAVGTVSPAGVWITQSNALYRFDPDQIAAEFVDANHLFAQDSRVVLAPGSLTVYPFFQGFVVHSGTSLWYLSENDKSNWKLLADDAVLATVSNRGVYWVSKNGQLLVQQFEQNNRRILTKSIPFSASIGDSMEYSLQWKRLIWRTQSGVYSVFHDTQVVDERIVDWTIQRWIDNGVGCNKKIFDFRLFCIQANTLKSYENKELFF